MRFSPIPYFRTFQTQVPEVFTNFLTIESQNDFKLQTEGLLELQSKTQQYEAEMQRYLDVFKRHDLSKLAFAKPGLIEPRVNKGTKNVFESIEEISRNIDVLDDGLQLQSNTD